MIRFITLFLVISRKTYVKSFIEMFNIKYEKKTLMNF